MNKPLPVKIVEVLGWMYVALSVVWIIVLIAAQVFGIDQEGEVWPLVLCGSFPLLLSLGMVLSLRRGRSGWFLVPNTVVFSLFLLGAIVSLTSLEGAVIAGVIAFLLVAPLPCFGAPLRPDGSIRCLATIRLGLSAARWSIRARRRSASGSKRRKLRRLENKLR